MTDINDIANAFGTADDDNVWVPVDAGARKYVDRPDGHVHATTDITSYGEPEPSVSDDANVLAEVYAELTSSLIYLDNIDLDKYDPEDLLALAIAATKALVASAVIQVRAAHAFAEERA